MAECGQLGFELPGLNGRKIEGNFQGGNVSSDVGLMLLRQVDRHLGLTKAIARWAGSGQDRTLLGEHVASEHLRLGAGLRRTQQ